jgi:hypothetical protein
LYLEAPLELTLKILIFLACAFVLGGLLLFWGWLLVGAIVWEKGAAKIAWAIVIIWLNLFGALIYFLYRISLGPKPMPRLRAPSPSLRDSTRR